jgi:hypothetical protein
MSQGNDLEELRQRKKELRLESEINRQILRIEAAQLRLAVTEQRRKWTTIGTAYRWIAPLAGVFFAVRGMRKKVPPRAARHNGDGKFNYMALLAPLGATVLRKAYGMWRHARRRARRPA